MAHEILIVDGEPDIRLLIEGILRDEGYDTRGAGDAEAAIGAFRTRRPSLVILDVWLQGSRMDGIGILETLQSGGPHGSEVERVARTGSRVMISGAAGSGKEVVARVIHARSRRSNGPFVVMNCATL